MRKSGILMHLSSLSSPYGIGTMGKEAREFVDFLQASGQSCWQILPICPTSYGDSPYQSYSTFAGNPYFIDLEKLQEMLHTIDISRLVQRNAGAVRQHWCWMNCRSVWQESMRWNRKSNIRNWLPPSMLFWTHFRKMREGSLFVAIGILTVFRILPDSLERGKTQLPRC